MKQEFIAHFRKGIPKSKVLSHLVEEATSSLATLEFPTRKEEEWKYTKINSIISQTYTQIPAIGSIHINDYLINGYRKNLLVFINGFYSEIWSTVVDEEMVAICSLTKAKNFQYPELEQYISKFASHNDNIFNAMNTVFSANGTFIHVAKNAKIENPIHILNIAQGKNPGINPRNLFVVEEGAEVKIINSFHSIGDGGGFVNSVTEILLQENAKLDLFLLQNQNNNSNQINTIEVEQKANSTFNSGVFTFGGALVRNNLNIKSNGKGSQTNINGLYVLKGKQHVDNHTRVDHLQPNCESNELYKGILSNQSTGVFNGKVYVKDIAQQTNAFQSNQTILMSDDAHSYSKPELEIYADDVKCSHGSTTGQFDEEAVFYLRSRGIGEVTARKLLVEAFATDVLDIISIADLRKTVEDMIHTEMVG